LVELVALVTAFVLTFMLYIFIPPLVDGIERKIKADIQSRYGPPTVLQTWYDILKLMSKEVVTSANPVFLLVPLSLSLTLALFLAIVTSYIAITHIDPGLGALLLVIILSVHTLNILTYFFSSNPFSILGTFRAISIDVLNEIGLALFLILMFVIATTSLSSNTLLTLATLIPLLVAIYVSHRRLPYDLHEAEPELASGSLIEFSGPLLGIHLYGHLLERYVLTSIPVAIVLHLGGPLNNPLLAPLVLHLTTTALYLVFGVVSAVLGRSKVNLAVKTLMFLYSLAIIIWVGVYVFEHTI